MPGRAPETAKREQFARLIAQGVSNRDACRIVGVNRRTGTRWRYGRSITSSSGRRLDYAPVVTARKQEISARYLSEDERVPIADLATRGETVRLIALERQNMARLTPIGPARDIAVVTLRLVIEAILEDNTALAAAILDQVVPESPDNSIATVAGCIGVALGLLDEWLSGPGGNALANLASKTRLPAGHWVGERAATAILDLARKGRAFRSLDSLIIRQGSPQVLYGSTLALAAAIQARSMQSDTPVPELTHTTIC